MARIKVIVAVSTDRWNRALAAQYNELKASTTEITVVNLRKGPESIEAFYDEAFAEPWVVQEVEKTPTQGFDGAIIYCFGNPGLYAAREAVDIPVVGIGEAAITLGTMLGYRMGIIVELVHAVHRVWRTVKLMGMSERVATVRSANIPVLDMDQRERLRSSLLEASRAAVEIDGADVLVLGCGSMFGIRQEIEAAFGVPVVEPGPAALKLVESLLALGLHHSKRAYPCPPGRKAIIL